MRKEFWKREMLGVKLTWMAAGALFLTLWSRLRDDRFEDKRGKGKHTEVHDLLALSLERGSEADLGQQAADGPLRSRKNTALGAQSGRPPPHRAPKSKIVS
jgi:hypothetical protein